MRTAMVLAFLVGFCAVFMSRSEHAGLFIPPSIPRLSIESTQKLEMRTSTKQELHKLKGPCVGALIYCPNCKATLNVWDGSKWIDPSTTN